VWGSLWSGIAIDAVNQARAFVRAEARKTPGETPVSALRLAEVDRVLQEMRHNVAGLTRDYQQMLADGQADAFHQFGFSIRTNNLKLSSSQLIVDIVSRVFRPGDHDGEASESDDGDEGDEEDIEPDEEDAAVAERQAIAANAYRLLSEWRTVPGLNAGAIDPNVLRTWVEETRMRLRDARRLRIGDIYIGKMLAKSPPDSDGSWPPRAVRDLLEVVESKELRDGLGTEIFNSLGATSRGVLDGGDQERDKAAVYREHADALADRWPQTAAVLRDAAESFERMGRDHDAEAERRRAGFGWA
jgi:hypothetical protein